MRRRAKRHGVLVENFDPVAIFQRDDWVCGICEEPIDPALEYPDPRSASIDHVKPFAVGGLHVSTNVQAAHLACNMSKGRRWVAA